MLRRAAFSFSLFHEHVRPAMGEAYPAAGLLPRAMQEALDRLAAPCELSLTGRLLGIKRLLDDEAEEVMTSAA